jgi:hypothetical protein
VSGIDHDGAEVVSSIHRHDPPRIGKQHAGLAAVCPTAAGQGNYFPHIPKALATDEKRVEYLLGLHNRGCHDEKIPFEEGPRFVRRQSIVAVRVSVVSDQQRCSDLPGRARSRARNEKSQVRSTMRWTAKCGTYRDGRADPLEGFCILRQNGLVE